MDNQTAMSEQIANFYNKFDKLQFSQNMLRSRENQPNLNEEVVSEWKSLRNRNITKKKHVGIKKTSEKNSIVGDSQAPD